MRYFPVFLGLAAGTVVLVGSGEPAATKLRLLLAAGAQVRRYVDHAMPAQDGVEVIVGASAQEIDLSDAVAVVVAAGDRRDDVIAARARQQRIPLNVVDRPDLSTFIMPAIVDRGEVIVAIGTGGLAPVLARRLRARIETLLPARIGELAALMGRYRSRLAAALTGMGARRRFWEDVVDGPIAAALLGGRPIEAEAALARAIGGGPSARRGFDTVFLVGAGPGDPDLLTLRALHVLQDADIVFYERGVAPAVLDRARRDAERICIEPGDAARRVREATQAGRRVAYLTHGTASPDRHEMLRAAGLPVVTVPGVADTTPEAARRAA